MWVLEMNVYMRSVWDLLCATVLVSLALCPLALGLL